MSPFTAYVLQTLVTLLAVVVIAILFLYGARRMGFGKPLGPMQLVGRLPLDARRAVYLVRVADQVLVLGVSEAGITRLGEVSATALSEADRPVERRFADVLGAFRARKAQAVPGPSDKPVEEGSHHG